MSLAGMYYYVEGKEDLLFEIQKGSFERVRRGAEEATAGATTPEEQLAGLHPAPRHVLRHATWTR